MSPVIYAAGCVGFREDGAVENNKALTRLVQPGLFSLFTLPLALLSHYSLSYTFPSSHIPNASCPGANETKVCIRPVDVYFFMYIGLLLSPQISSLVCSQAQP
jgi:hypothetical protein